MLPLSNFTDTNAMAVSKQSGTRRHAVQIITEKTWLSNVIWFYTFASLDVSPTLKFIYIITYQA